MSSATGAATGASSDTAWPRDALADLTEHPPARLGTLDPHRDLCLHPHCCQRCSQLVRRNGREAPLVAERPFQTPDEQVDGRDRRGDLDRAGTVEADRIEPIGAHAADLAGRLAHRAHRDPDGPPDCRCQQWKADSERDQQVLLKLVREFVADAVALTHPHPERLTRRGRFGACAHPPALAVDDHPDEALAEWLDRQRGAQRARRMRENWPLARVAMKQPAGHWHAAAKIGGPGNFASYARTVGSRRESNGKRKGSGNTKCGNRHLAWAFVEAASAAVRYDERIKRFYQRKKAKTLPVVAFKAVAHKLARACFHVMKTGEPFGSARPFD